MKKILQEGKYSKDIRGAAVENKLFRLPTQRAPPATEPRAVTRGLLEERKGSKFTPTAKLHGEH